MIDLDYCYFHAITPLHRNYQYLNYQDALRLRLEYILRTKALVPGNDLCLTLPNSFSNEYFSSHCSVFLAQSLTTKLPSIGGSYHNGNFSAFSEHIAGKPSLLFHHSVAENLQVHQKRHSLSEEVCIEENVPLTYAIGIALPYATPLSFLIDLENKLQNSFLQQYLFFSAQRYRYELQKIMINPKRAILASYEEVLKYQALLQKYQYNIPCINYQNYFYHYEEELNNIPHILERAHTLYEKF